MKRCEEMRTSAVEERADRRRWMVEEQIRDRGVTDARVLEAMLSVPRERFVPEDARELAYDDRALSVEYGQTISQPFIVAYMTEKLSVTSDCRVLEVGTGTGYQTAILARLARMVYSVERIEGLHRKASSLLESLGIRNVALAVGDGSVGLPDHAPFDRIMVTASAPRVPTALMDQLSEGGILVAPIGGECNQTIVRMERQGARTVETPLLGCRFVKLIGREGWSEGFG